MASKRDTPAPTLGRSTSEWQILRTHRPNVLLTGPHDTTEAALATLWPQFRPPMHEWLSEAALPGPGDAFTLLIRDVDALSLDQQRILLAWLDCARRHQIQVVSTTPLELFLLVEGGFFLERLYYRLNILRLDAPLLRVDAANGRSTC